MDDILQYQFLHKLQSLPYIEAILAIIDEVDTLLKIDCVHLDQLSTSSKLKENILKDTKIIYSMYDDLKPSDAFFALGKELTRFSEALAEDTQKTSY